MKRSLLLLLGFLPTLFQFKPVEPALILVFSKTVEFRHESIETGIEAIKKLGTANNFSIYATEDASYFTSENLAKYQAVLFLNTSGDVLNDPQQVQLEKYMQAGGNFIGIHSATDTEYDWPWYGKMVGAYFNGHPDNPNVRTADVLTLDGQHVSCKHLPSRFSYTDEWYNFKNINPDLNILLNLDETSYEGGTNGDQHPISWYQEFEQGRVFYTGLGHTIESFHNELFLKHLQGGIEFVLGDRKLPDYEDLR